MNKMNNNKKVTNASEKSPLSNAMPNGAPKHSVALDEKLQSLASQSGKLYSPPTMHPMQGRGVPPAPASSHSPIPPLEEEPLFDDLQPFFDEQSRHLSTLLSHPSAQLTTLNFRHALTFRRQMLRCWLPLAIFSISVSVIWAFNLWNYNYDRAYIFYNIIAEIILTVAAVHASVIAIAILLHHPARSSFDSMLRFARFFNMQPQQSSLANQPRQAKRPRTLQPSMPNRHVAITYFSRVACLCGILVFTLFAIVCTPSPYTAPAPDQLSTEHLNNFINNIQPL